MAVIGTPSQLTTPLMEILKTDAIEPGAVPSYQMCKTLYLHHPLGAKMAEAPISMAQSQKRDISVSDGPDRVVDEFGKQWAACGADKHIFNLFRLARVYGIATLVAMVKDDDTNTPLDMGKLYKADLGFNVLDPLNTSGSLVMNQQPNEFDFQKHQDVVVQGKRYHRSRTCTILNEEPIYISFTSSTFGFTGRSVYQRALFPMKSYVQSLITNDMVQRKCGLLVAKIKQAGSIIDNAVSLFTGRKRQLLKDAETDSVISVGSDDDIQSLNMQNLEAPAIMSRTNILKDIATSADMPAKLLENETLVEGFGEGTEDAKNIARYVERFRESMQPAYDFMDKLVMRRAWTPEFFDAVKAQFPAEYKNMEFKEAFYQWSNSFKAQWPSLLIEPDSEKIKVQETKYKSVVAIIEVIATQLDPQNKAKLFMWAQDIINENTMLFPYQLDLDFEALEEHLEEQKDQQEQLQEQQESQGEEGVDEPPKPARPFARGDSDNGAARRGGRTVDGLGKSESLHGLVAQLVARQQNDTGRKTFSITKNADGTISGFVAAAE
jgi:hypothetical protein